MTDSVKFEVNIEQTISSDELDKRIEALMEKHSRGQMPTTPLEQPEQEAQKPEREPTEVGEGGLISMYGGAQQPRKHYPVKRTKRELPETGEAPFEYTDDSQTIAPGRNYTAPRGFQQEKVSRRGTVRRGHDSPDSSPLAGIKPDSIRDRLDKIDKEMKEKTDKTEMEKMMKERIGNVLEGSQVFTDPQRFVQDNLMKTLGNVARAHPIISLIVGAIMTGPAMYEMARGIIQQMAVKGGPLNRDFVVQVEEVVTGFLSLEEQHLRDIGVKGFVVSQADGYSPVSGTDVYNSLLDKDEVRLNRIPLEDRV